MPARGGTDVIIKVRVLQGCLDPTNHVALYTSTKELIDEERKGNCTFPVTVTVKGDEIDRAGVPRFKGAAVCGSKGGRFIRLAEVTPAGKVVGLAKVLLTSNGTTAAASIKNWITHDMVQQAASSNGYIFGVIDGPKVTTGSTPMYLGGWMVVAGGQKAPSTSGLVGKEGALGAAPEPASKAKAKAKAKAAPAKAPKGLKGEVEVRVLIDGALPKSKDGARVVWGMQPVKDRSNLSAAAEEGKASCLFKLRLGVNGVEASRPTTPRFNGPFVWGSGKDGRHLVLRALFAKDMKPGNVAGGMKVLLSHNNTRAAKAVKQWPSIKMVQQALASEGAYLYCGMAAESANSAPLLGHKWHLVKAGEDPPDIGTSAPATSKRRSAAAASAPKRKRSRKK